LRLKNVKKTGLPADAAKTSASEAPSPPFTPDEYKEMLSAISEAQSLFIEEPGRAAFDKLLDVALHLTGSEFGFIGEVLQDVDGAPYLKERATLSRIWNAELDEFFDQHYQQGFELRNFDNLFGAAIARGQPIIVNDAAQFPGRGEPLPGHPVIHTFLGLPLYQWDEVVGIIGLVNRPGGYSESLCEELEPVSTSCASLILASRNYTARQQMETALYESEKKRRLLFENSRDALMVLAPPSWKFISANQAALQLLGAASKEEFMALGLWDVCQQWQPDGRSTAEKVREMIDLAVGKGAHSFECELRRLDGGTFVADILLTRVETAGLPTLQATMRDITAQRQAKLALRQESQKNEMLLRVASDGVHILDSSGHLKLMSDSFCRMLGYSRSEMQGMHVSQWEAEWSDAGRQARIGQLEREGTTYETRHRRKDGTLLNVEVNARSVILDGVPMLYCSSRDITERKLAENNFIRQANYDSLTRLPNRNLFRDRLEQEVKKSHRSGWPMALMLIDLDRFKEVNDTLGHDKGDLLLVEAARRVVSCVRESDTVARLGGDEFTVILSELDDTRSVDRIAQKIIRRLAAPFQLGEEQAFISASVGITLYPSDATDIDALLKNADQAMYLAKNQGRNRFCFFTTKLQEAAQKRMRLSNDLRNALLAGNQFRVHYQPIVELATGGIYKAEALVRWQHPTRGLVSPVEFIPLAEESGMIVEIGDWVFQRAMQQCKQWRTTHHPEFQISVNRSPVQFHHDISRSKEWISYLHQANIPGQCLVIEITEGLLLNVEGSIRDKLLAFRDAGIQVAIDDFGTGYSSLSYLNQLDIDYLKIDQSFVRNLESSSSDIALCEAIIIMAHKLGLKTIAEGVSTEGQRDLLARAGCDYAQGYLYSKPVPAEEFVKLLQAKAPQ
jgi:diguanylate cyclase (GGDEF)-like protein/PAS domain S-box-containing protein